MKYEDMSIIQLKSLCRDHGLGTGRSKIELIQKLKAYDSRIPLEDNTPAEDETDSISEGVASDDLETASTTEEPENSGPKLFGVNFPHVGLLLDSDHEQYRRLTWEQAVEDGFTPFGGPTTPRLSTAKNGYLTYELEVH